MNANALALFPLLIAFLMFPLAAKLVLRFAPVSWRPALFAVVNIALALSLAGVAASKGVRLKEVRTFLPIGAGFCLLYLGLVGLQYLNLVVGRRRSGAWAWIGVAYPLVLLALLKYVPSHWNPLQHLLGRFPDKVVPEFFLGLSYMAFRLSHMVYEVRNGIAAWPSIWEFLSFAFFVPTFSIGPINPFSRFQKSLAEGMPGGVAGPALLRIAVGAAKYLLVANLFNQLSWHGLLFDGHPHKLIDMVVASLAYCVFLYGNFSGYCDMAIGVSALLGISVMENFNDPFLARNIQEFWNRWHITLSTYMRDMMFTPLSKSLVRRFGPKMANHCIALSIFAVFVVVGVWHGAGWNFFLFGVWNGIGLVACHYYSAFLKRRLSKQAWAAYHSNRWIHAVGVVVTFVYFSAGLALVANNLPQLGTIFQMV